ncbi:MAG: hypothetical protein FWB96_12390 [Defluviitaleaceae bacterium]|nr:hypothetical protein [Defluviitaleaceae bacterium]MCL2264284.1 hypothetical protein [Defluviitaleaceae bacterium]
MHHVKCDVVFCIFNKNKNCLLPSMPKLNGTGICKDCEFVKIEDEILNAAKKRALPTLWT